MVKLPKFLAPQNVRSLRKDNPFRQMVWLLKSSVGRMPGRLVVLLVFSLSIAISCGVLVQLFAMRENRSEYLALRIKPQDGKPVLQESLLRGVWVLESPPYVVTLRLGSGVFEMVVRDENTVYSRYFIRGGYKTEGNVLILQQRKDLGTPFDPQHFDYKFFPLEFRSINMFVTDDGKQMIWSVPYGELRRLDNREEALMRIFGKGATWMRIATEPS